MFLKNGDAAFTSSLRNSVAVEAVPSETYARVFPFGSTARAIATLSTFAVLNGAKTCVYGPLASERYMPIPKAAAYRLLGLAGSSTIFETPRTEPAASALNASDHVAPPSVDL